MGSIIKDLAVPLIFGAVGVYFLVILSIGQTTDVCKMRWFSPKLGALFLGPQAALYLDLALMSGDFFSDVVYFISTVLDTGFEHPSLLVLSIMCMVIPTMCFAIYIGLIPSFLRASALVWVACAKASSNAIGFLGNQLLLPEYKTWRTMERFIGYIATRVIWLFLAAALSLALYVVICPAVIAAWLATVALMLLAGMNLKLFALTPFLSVWDAVLLREGDAGDDVIARQTFRLNAGIFFHLLAESTPELLIVIINENLKVEETRWSTLAMVEIIYSSLTLLKELWPITYSVLKSGSFGSALAVPILPLSEAQADEIEQRLEIDRSEVGAGARRGAAAWST